MSIALHTKMNDLATSKTAFLRERGYQQVAVVMVGPSGCATVSSAGRVAWLGPTVEMAITGKTHIEADAAVAEQGRLNTGDEP